MLACDGSWRQFGVVVVKEKDGGWLGRRMPSLSPHLSRLQPPPLFLSSPLARSQPGQQLWMSLFMCSTACPFAQLTRRGLQRLHYQNRVGSKFGGGGPAGASEANVDRRERLRKLALETIDISSQSLFEPALCTCAALAEGRDSGA